MDLYYSKPSPYARKARVVAAELGISDRIRLVEIDPRDPATGFWKLNPLGKIPALVIDQDTIMFDSPVICEYLDQAVGDGRLLPGDRCWRIRTLVAFADGILDAGMAVRLERVRPENEQSPAWIDKQLATVGRGLDGLQDVLPELHHRVDLASIAAGCAIGWILHRHAYQDWLGPRPELAAWYETFAARDSMRQTAP